MLAQKNQAAERQEPIETQATSLERLAVFSDSHGNMVLLRRAVASALQRGAGILVHLGDDYADLAAVDTQDAVVWKVPGLRCAELSNPFIDRVSVFSFGSWRISAVHDLSMLPPASGSQNRELVLYGHTHIPDCELGPDGRWYLNPGHLKAARDRGADAGFVMVYLQPDVSLRIEFLFPDGRSAKSVPSRVTVLD